MVYTQDWHPPVTPHFEKDGGVWPVHCVRGSWGAELHPDLRVEGEVVRKGTGGEDGYSGFTMRDPVTGEEKPTRLDEVLRERRHPPGRRGGVVPGLCVRSATALDAVAEGYDTVVPESATRPGEVEPGDEERAWEEMRQAGSPSHDGRGAALFTDLYELTMAASYHRLKLDHGPPSRCSSARCPRTGTSWWRAASSRSSTTWKDGASSPTNWSTGFDRALPGRLPRAPGEHSVHRRGVGHPRGDPGLPQRAPPPCHRPHRGTGGGDGAVEHARVPPTMVASKAARVALAWRHPFRGLLRPAGPRSGRRAVRRPRRGSAAGGGNVPGRGGPASRPAAHGDDGPLLRHDLLRTRRRRSACFLAEHPTDGVLLIDTYDTLEGARRAASAARELAPEGVPCRAVRLDSGEVGVLARQVRQILDDAGLTDVDILASGDMDEHASRSCAPGAPVDALGVGTRLGHER